LFYNVYANEYGREFVPLVAEIHGFGRKSPEYNGPNAPPLSPVPYRDHTLVDIRDTDTSIQQQTGVVSIIAGTDNLDGGTPPGARTQKTANAASAKN
jgi:hypothetical protein